MRSIRRGQTGLNVSFIALGCQSYGKFRPAASACPTDLIPTVMIVLFGYATF